MRQRGNYSVFISSVCLVIEMHKYENLNSDLRSVLSGTNFITSDCNSGGEAFATDDIKVDPHDMTDLCSGFGRVLVKYGKV